MDWIRWIALLQPIILSLALIFFRPQWVGLAHENKDALSISSSSPDIDDIREKLKYLEESALSSKNLDGIEDSISDLYKLTGEMQEVVRKYSKHEGPVNCCNGSRTNIGIAVLALIQLLIVICNVILWRKVLRLQTAPKENAENTKLPTPQKENAENTKTNNILRGSAT